MGKGGRGDRDMPLNVHDVTDQKIQKRRFYQIFIFGKICCYIYHDIVPLLKHIYGILKL